jgi:regulator of nucleoside diphosphate kinase
MEKIKITDLDYSRLSTLIQNVEEFKREEPMNLMVLKEELTRAAKVSPMTIEPVFVTMNSTIEILDLDTNKKMKLTLVYPKEANFKKGKVSIFSLLGIALIGYKEGSIIHFNAPSGRKRIQIINIIYQPEAHGEFTV